MDYKNAAKLVAAVLLCQLAGILGAVFTTPSIPTWYATLIKPAFTPPSWIFGPAWITLYALMGIALYLVWRKGEEGADIKKALSIFGIQLVLNTLWSILFFGLHSPLYGLACIIALWAAIAVSIFLFYKISRAAAILLIPYLLWVSFATILNFHIWQLN
ncbi:tryptophan-rich sensory protein [Candidatus Micrarchaeota archaeon]|nr:tryptophan-rich sensory protein [Candidatus Micrarchaeota archaeon]